MIKGNQAPTDKFYYHSILNLYFEIIKDNIKIVYQVGENHNQSRTRIRYYQYEHGRK